jgi:hypothetical protein
VKCTNHKTNTPKKPSWKKAVMQQIRTHSPTASCLFTCSEHTITQELLHESADSHLVLSKKEGRKRIKGKPNPRPRKT